MNIVMFVYAFILFFILTPGILLSLPPKGSKIVVALTHAFVFALVWCFTNKIVKRSTKGLFEGMDYEDDMNSTSDMGDMNSMMYDESATQLDMSMTPSP